MTYEVLCYIMFDGKESRRACREVFEELGNTGKFYSQRHMANRIKRYVVNTLREKGFLVLKREYPGKKWYYVPNKAIFGELMKEAGLLSGVVFAEYRPSALTRIYREFEEREEE